MEAKPVPVKWSWWRPGEDMRVELSNGVVRHLLMRNNGSDWGRPGEEPMWDGDMESPTLAKSISFKKEYDWIGIVELWHGHLIKGVFSDPLGDPNWPEEDGGG